MKKFLVFILFVYTSFSFAENAKIKLGEYEMKIINKLSNLPANLPPSVVEILKKPHVLKVCIKDNSNKAVVEKFTNNANCKISKMEQKEKKLSWKGACTGQVSVNVEGFVVIEKESYSGENSALTHGPNNKELKVVNEFVAHRLGDCK